MAYTTTQLVTRSWYLSGVVARDFETVTGDQLNDGLDMLNAFIAIKTADQRLIPYYTEYSFSAVVGQEKYFIPDLILAETLAFDLNQVRYPMLLVQRHEYFGSSRANNVLSLPYQYYIERAFEGSNLYMYFFPDQTYQFKIHGKFSLANVTLGQDLSLTLDQYYLEYLRYGLAQYMCQEYNIVFQQQNNEYLMQLEKILFDISPIDFTVQKKSMLQRQQGPDIYGQVNIGKGWTRTA